MNRFLLFCLIGIIILATAGAVIAEEQNALQNELNNLTSGLNNQGYAWLVNYAILQLNEKVYNNYELLYSNLRLT